METEGRTKDDFICDICEEEIGVNEIYFKAIRDDGKLVSICKKCTSEMKPVDPADAPPMPTQVWDKDSN